VQATAELRRTSLGYLCMDNGPGTPCFVVARERRTRARAASKRQPMQGDRGGQLALAIDEAGEQ
jgi:hypothetical protein